MVGRIAYKTFLVNQVPEPESQTISLTIKVSLLRGEIVSTDSKHKLEKYPQLYLKLDRSS